jgi:hypothetical protein
MEGLQGAGILHVFFFIKTKCMRALERKKESKKEIKLGSHPRGGPVYLPPFRLTRRGSPDKQGGMFNYPAGPHHSVRCGEGSPTWPPPRSNYKY